MYAGKALVDPVQYSCQKNFTILSTDGFWNQGAGFKIDGSAIGNQDNNLTTAPRPKYDGNLLATRRKTDGYRTANARAGVFRQENLATKAHLSRPVCLHALPLAIAGRKMDLLRQARGAFIALWFEFHRPTRAYC